MTLGDDKEGLGEDCSNRSRDSSREGDNNFVNINKDTNVHICEGDNLWKTKFDDDDSKSFETLQIQKKKLPSIHHRMNVTTTCVNIGKDGITDKDHDDGINMESMAKKQQQEQPGTITNQGVNADPKEHMSTNKTYLSSTVVGVGVGKDAIAPPSVGDNVAKNIGTPIQCQTKRSSAVGAYKHQGLNRKTKADKSSTRSGTSSSTVGAQRGTTGRGIAKKNPSPGKPVAAGSARHKIDCDRQKESIQTQVRITSSHNHNNNASPNENRDILDDPPITAAIDTVGKYFEDDLLIETSRRANPSGIDAVDTGGGSGGDAAALAQFEDDLHTKKSASVGRGYGDNAAKNIGTPTPRQNTTTSTDSPVLEVFVGQSSHTRKSLTSYILDNNNGGPPPNNNNNNQLPADLCMEKGPIANPSYIAYLDSNASLPPFNNNNNINQLSADFEPMTMPAPPNNDGVLPQEERPGAYSATYGSRLQRLDQINFSLIGVQPESLDQATMIQQQQQQQDDDDSQPVHGLELVEQHEQQLPNLDSSSNSHGALVQALPVGSSSFYYFSMRMRAQPVHQLELDQGTARETKEKKHKRFARGIVALACLVLIVSLAVGLTKKNKPSNVLENKTSTPDRVGLPPMENLELLYEELPEKTKESISNRDSPQYQAWDWTLNHPNITTYPEWRKKQVFAMATFFYSFEGPNWPIPKREKWLNVNTSECSWGALELVYIAQRSAETYGDAYGLDDYQPCNKHGQLQTLFVHHLNLPTAITPAMPPEIRLLTSVRILAILFSQIGGELSDIIVPELIELPNLIQLSLYASGIRGTIPTNIGLMTGLRSLTLSKNYLGVSIPTEIGEMTSLEHINVGDVDNLSGDLPSELGLMTRLTGLEIYRSSVGGAIPTELGSLSNMRKLYLGGNRLTAEIPSELGLMTNTKELWLGNNALKGGLPSQLGEMSHLVELWLGNDLSYTGPPANFTGSFPLELWELSSLEVLYLPHLPNLSGSIPTETMMPNLTKLSLSGSPNLSGTIPGQLCLIVEELDFDCSDLLCGCDCQCVSNKTKSL